MPSQKQKHSLRCRSILVVLAMLICTSDGAFASSWSPTLLVNTEAFQIIDDTDSAANLYIQFGGTLAKKLTYDRTGAQFRFDDDLEVYGTASGQWLHAQDRLRSSGSLAVDGAGFLNNEVTFGSGLIIRGVTYRFPASDGSATGKVLKTD